MGHKITKPDKLDFDGSKTKFTETFHNSEIIITEGSLAERLKSEYKTELDDFVNHSGLIYSNPSLIKNVYQQYLDIGKKYDLPILITTPTRNVNKTSVAKSKFKGKNIHSDSISFLKEIRNNYGDYSSKIFIGGMIGCKGDAYSGTNHLNTSDAYNFHKMQASEIASQKPDFILGTLMPEINETIGMAKAIAETGIPYIISFMIRKDGMLLDKTPLFEAIRIIDQEVNPKPLCYITNCIHPTNLLSAINCDLNKNQPEIQRLAGLQANASILSPEELDKCTITQQNDFEKIIDEIKVLHEVFNLKILGGCCGTNDIFIEKLSKNLKKYA